MIASPYKRKVSELSNDGFEVQELCDSEVKMHHGNATFYKKIKDINIGIIIEKMKMMHLLLMCALKGNQLFLKYLDLNQHQYQQMIGFSEQVDDCFIFPSELEKYALALNHFKSSHGYSMFSFLKKHDELACFLYHHIDELMPIQRGFLSSYSKNKPIGNVTPVKHVMAQESENAQTLITPTYESVDSKKTF